MSNSGRASWHVMFRVLMRMQFARLRRNWRPYVIVSAVMPAGIVLLLYFMNHHMPRFQREDVITGAMLLSESIATIVMLSQYIAWLKETRALDHYRILPVSLEMLVTALATAYGAFAWPGIGLIALESHYLEHLPLHFSLWLIPLWLLTGLSMGSVGTIIGLLSPDEGLAGLFGNLLMMAILFLGMLPMSSIGPWTTGLWILPSTGPLHLLKALMFSSPIKPFLWWSGTILYAAAGLILSAWVIKRPT